MISGDEQNDTVFGIIQHEIAGTASFPTLRGALDATETATKGRPKTIQKAISRTAVFETFWHYSNTVLPNVMCASQMTQKNTLAECDVRQVS